MIGASKILTVSYGTFSCTLEGFDDPFNTMRAIAEYFRDLAAEDRYFGAEPPTPDAAMLHRIAERELQRRVEARVQDNGVILRAGDVRVTSGVPAMVPQDLTIEPALAAGLVGADAMADRLARLRDLPTPTETITAIPEADLPQAAAPLDDIVQEEAAVAIADLPVADVEPVAEAADVEAMADAPEAVVGTDFVEPVAEVAPSAEADAPSLGAAEYDLLAEATVDITEPQEFVELEASDDAQPEMIDAPFVPEQDDLAAPVAETEVTDAELAQQVAEDLSNAADTSDDDILLATLGAMIDPEGDDDLDDMPDASLPDADLAALFASPSEAAEATVEATVEPAAAEPDAAPFEVALSEVGLSEVGQSEVAVSDEAEPVPADHDMAELAANEPEVAEASPLSTDPVQERLQRARARVIKIRRINTTATVAEPVVATPDAAQAPEADAASLSVLSPEAEAELQRELADLEADSVRAAEPVADHVDASLEAALQDEPAAAEPHKLPVPTPADDAVNRLISQTNAALEGPENKRRLAAIAHLKAAVAATFADRKSSPGPAQPGPEVRMDPYREDLDRVVRPRRPALVAPTAQDAAPSVRPQVDTRPAPLVLVSEQRIDRPTAPRALPANVTPVRPRRVTTTLMPTEPQVASQVTDEDDEDGYLPAGAVSNIFSDPNQPFADFADRLGATSMPELLEAAAAYCALLLGRDQFTRPLLLQQIADLPTGAEITREDCLRGFGTLLRDGRIEKIKRGQFRLSDQSRYLADGKRIAG